MSSYARTALDHWCLISRIHLRILRVYMVLRFLTEDTRVPLIRFTSDWIFLTGGGICWCAKIPAGASFWSQRLFRKTTMVLVKDSDRRARKFLLFIPKKKTPALGRENTESFTCRCIGFGLLKKKKKPCYFFWLKREMIAGILRFERICS